MNACPPPTLRAPARPRAARSRVPGSIGEAGFTILETTVASALLALFLVSLFALNSTVMRMLRSANETTGASQELQCRVEQIRLTNWLQITNPTYVKELFARPTDATTDLPDLEETFYVRPYSFAAPDQAPAYKCRRAPDGTMSTPADGPTASGANLADPNVALIRFDVILSWRSWGGRTRTRMLTTVVSRWGISK